MSKSIKNTKYKRGDRFIIKKGSEKLLAAVNTPLEPGMKVRYAGQACNWRNVLVIPLAASLPDGWMMHPRISWAIRRDALKRVR